MTGRPLVENVADPSHVPFAHHGIQGNRDRAMPIPLNIVRSTMDIIEAQVDKTFLKRRLLLNLPVIWNMTLFYLEVINKSG